MVGGILLFVVNLNWSDVGVGCDQTPRQRCPVENKDKEMKDYTRTQITNLSTTPFIRTSCEGHTVH